MCGRFVLYSTEAELAATFDALPEEAPPPPSYNIAPGSRIRVVRIADGDRRILTQAHWGLIPSWAKDRKLAYRTINARAETVAEKPTFRAAFRQRRCLIPANGFYEWKATEHGKQPYYIQHRDQHPFAFAGLWEQWSDPQTGELVPSTTIIVTQANALVRTIHERMPVILAPEDHATWLAASSSPHTLQSLLKPVAPDAMTLHPVDTRVNTPGNDDPSLIAPEQAG